MLAQLTNSGRKTKTISELLRLCKQWLVSDVLEVSEVLEVSDVLEMWEFGECRTEVGRKASYAESGSDTLCFPVIISEPILL